MVSYSKKSSAEWIIDQLNVENAKLVAFVLVIGFIGYHGILHLRYGKLETNFGQNVVSRASWIIPLWPLLAQKSIVHTFLYQ